MTRAIAIAVVFFMAMPPLLLLQAYQQLWPEEWSLVLTVASLVISLEIILGGMAWDMWNG